MKNEKGFTLVETLIAMLVLAVIAVAFLAALNAAGKALYITNERQKAISLAESQMEYVKQQGYFFSYSPVPISNEYAGYSVTIDTSNITSRDWNIQGISVIVSHQGKPIIITGGATLQDYKVN